METNPDSNRRTARLAAAMFLFLCIPLSVWGQMYVGSKIFVPQDPAATAANLLANEFIFRSSIVVNILGIVVFSLMTMLIYRIFKPVDKFLALLMIVPIIAHLPITVIVETFNFAAILILKSEARPDFGTVQQQETVYFLMRLHRAIMSCDKFFLGLSFIPWGILVWRSGYMPRIFGVLLIISATGYVADTVTGILFDRSIVVIIRPWLRGMFLGYIATMFWLLIKGVHEKRVIVN